MPRESADVYDDDAHTGDPERDLAYEREQAMGGGGGGGSGGGGYM